MSLLLSARLARREVRRRPVRTILVALLVAVPALAFIAVSTVGHTSFTTQEERFRERNGTGDIVLGGVAGVDRDDVERAARDLFGDGVTVAARPTTWTAMRLNKASVSRSQRSKILEVRGWGPDDPVLGTTLELIEGRAARHAGEAILTPSLARAWKATVGETLSFSIPESSLTVVGIARVRRAWNENAVMVSPHGQLPNNLGFYSQPDFQSFVVDVPGAMTWARFSAEHPSVVAAIFESQTDGVSESGQVEAAHGAAQIWRNASFVDGGPNGPEFSQPSSPWSAVVLILEFAVLSIVIAAAFATSARRQLVVIGQLGANGASASTLRASLAMQGMWCGLVGIGLAGVVYAVLLATSHAVVEQGLAHDLGSWRIPVGSLVLVSVVALMSSTLAAWLPARSAAKATVLDALAGRSRTANVPRQLLPAGILLLVVGTALEFLVAVGVRNDTTGSNSSLYMVTGALGGLLILAGVCCLGPVIVSVFGPIGSRTSGILRLTARSLSRGRARSAAVVVAIAAFVSIGLTASTGYLSTNSQEMVSMTTARNMVAVWGMSCISAFAEVSSTDVPEPCVLTPVLPAVNKSVGDTMLGAQSAPLRWAIFDPSPYPRDQQGTGAVSSMQLEIRDPGGIVVGDPLVLESLKLSKLDRREYERNGAIYVSDPSMFTPESLSVNGIRWFNTEARTARINLMTRAGEVGVDAYVNRDRSRAALGSSLVITESKAQELGLEVRQFGQIFKQRDDLQDWQRAELQFISNFATNEPSAGSVSTSIAMSWDRPSVDSRLVQLLITGVVMAITLLIVAIGLSLMAAEGKDERDVLVAIGSPPRTLSSLAALRACLLAACAVVLAIPVGLIPVSIVLNASNSGSSNVQGVVIPWFTIALLFCVPAVVYLVTRVTGTIARLARPVRMSNFSFD